MLIKLSKWDLKRFIQALNMAIEWEESYIDCCSIGLKRKNKKIKRYIPEELKQYTKISKKNIKAFKKLINKLKESY